MYHEEKKGLALYIHSHHHSRQHSDLSILSIQTESHFLGAFDLQRNILVGVVDRRPNTQRGFLQLHVRSTN